MKTAQYENQNVLITQFSINEFIFENHNYSTWNHSMKITHHPTGLYVEGNSGPITSQVIYCEYLLIKLMAKIIEAEYHI